MRGIWRASGLVALSAVAAGASDLTIHLAGSGMVDRKLVKYQCDAQGEKMGLPSGPFKAEYLNLAPNFLVVVPVKGKSQIFVSVPSGSGAKYASAQYTWWEAGGEVTFNSDFPGPKAKSTCKVAK